MCLVFEGDFFKVISVGKVLVVIDYIECFIEFGVLFKFGMELKVDIIIMVIGLNV